jgi:hypothetical protein
VAVAEAKGLSTEITIVSEVDTLFLVANSSFVFVKVRIQDPDGVRDHSKITQGTNINLGEP